MSNRKTLLTIALILVVGGLAFYYTANKQTPNQDVTKDTKVLAAEHHDDDDQVKSYEIYPGDVVKKINDNEDIVLLDVRTPEEYEMVHLENSLLLPVQVLSQQSLNDIGLGESMKDKEIYIYCRSGNRSRTAYNIMESLGYANIKSVAGGMVHWEEDEYPFTQSGAYDESAMMSGGDTLVNDSLGPQITLNRTAHDFGVIPQYGGTVETDFTVTNNGKETLEIGDITTSCSCTSAKIDKLSIAAGDSTTLTVVFDPDLHEEPLDVFKRTVFIPSNDPKNPEAEVSITVDIAEGQ